MYTDHLARLTQSSFPSPSQADNNELLKRENKALKDRVARLVAQPPRAVPKARPPAATVKPRQALAQLNGAEDAGMRVAKASSQLCDA